MLDTGRDLNLHPLFRAPWKQRQFEAPAVIVPQGNTSFDPFLGTGWGEWLDAMGASDPEGANLRMPLRGLRDVAKGKPNASR